MSAKAAEQAKQIAAYRELTEGLQRQVRAANATADELQRQLDLAKRGKDVRCYVHALEGWVFAALAEFGVAARRAEGRIGIWCDNLNGQEAKIGAIGVRIRKWVTAHGFAVNVAPNLSHFGGIVPCGIAEFPVTSLADLGISASLADFDAALHRTAPDFLSALAKAGESCDLERVEQSV